MNAQGIVLKGMPNLEWASKNLTGHGGTEVNGRWYYTWDRAMAAAAELGDGWRLPTAEEFEMLCYIGSTWDAKRKGRWFGGNHDTDHAGSLFLPAAGFLHRGTGAVTNVGAEGLYWGGTLYSSGAEEGNLFFSSGEVDPVDFTEQTLGLAVRLVRNNK